MANIIVDPFERNLHLERKHDFFGENKQIILDKSFFDFFGFNKTIAKISYNYVNSGENKNTKDIKEIKKNVKNGFRYSINLEFNGKKVNVGEITDKNEKIVKGVNEHFFEGNAEKADFLSAKNSNEDKKAFVVIKELGDVLQVLLMFIWGKYKDKHPSQYTMVTVDHIVFLFCQILGEPCHFFNNGNSDDSSSDKIQKKENTKFYKIEYFLPQEITEEVIAQREKEKREELIRQREEFLKKLSDDFKNKKKEIYNLNDRLKKKIQDFIDGGKYVISEISETEQNMNKEHILLLQFLVAKINKTNSELKKAELSDKNSENMILSETKALDNYIVQSIFHKTDDKKIMTKVSIDGINLDYRAEIVRLKNNNTTATVADKFKFGIGDLKKLLEIETQKQPEEAEEELLVLSIPPQPQQNKNSPQQSSNNSNPFFTFYDAILKYNRELFRTISNNIFGIARTSNITTGGKRTRKYKKLKKTRKIQGGQTHPVVFSKEEYEKEHRVPKNFLGSEYGYGILDESFKLNLLEQINKLALSRETKPMLKQFIETRIAFDTNPSSDEKTAKWVEDFFGDIYSQLCYDFYREGEVSYDEKLLEKVFEICKSGVKTAKTATANSHKIALMNVSPAETAHKQKLASTKGNHIAINQTNPYIHKTANSQNNTSRKRRMHEQTSHHLHKKTNYGLNLQNYGLNLQQRGL